MYLSLSIYLSIYLSLLFTIFIFLYLSYLFTTTIIIIAEIVNSFKNQEIQFKFMQLQNQILTNHNNNTAKNELRRMEVESQMKEWREGNELVQKQLDEQMDGVRSKFADVQVGLNYDVGLLEKKFETVPKVRWYIYGGEE